MIYWNKLDHFFRLVFPNHDLFHQYVCIVSITVQNSEVQYSDFMNLFNMKLIRTHIACNILTLNKCLQGPVFSFQ